MISEDVMGLPVRCLGPREFQAVLDVLVPDGAYCLAPLLVEAAARLLGCWPMMNGRSFEDEMLRRVSVENFADWPALPVPTAHDRMRVMRARREDEQE